ncbi:MAG: 3-methyl-2-oxobutanoate hydroxymethyltransferase [Actinomycetota bacterium]|jgi:3-methyl-2-oxobutanoate hydroxymethyltransferase|nr:3-methyl-2-oxobutanoate hydroxymethyltransferase [Euzebyaceae bacterium]MDQ3451393.1 3-methyl-2-oxobutanoate hydroxymethyltransferase [Actinomycetota bacterium]
MSLASQQRPITIQDIQGYKARGERFVMLTAYDHPTAQILDQAGVGLLLVGDSLGDNVLGYPSTVPVTLDEMIHHAAAVRRGAHRALVIGDLPFMSYQVSPEDGMRAAGRLLKEAGVTAVKLEGGRRCAELVARLVDAGIPVMGHIGLTPQSVNVLGYRVQGRETSGADRLLDDAVALAEAGAFSIVVEAVPAELGQRITGAVDVPTIGIGAGPHTDGQVLVINDVLGLSTGPHPRFAKAYADLRSVITDAVKSLSAEVASGDYPGPEHSY